MYVPKMELTDEQRDILNGKQGEVMAKIMETIVMFGDMFEAPRLIKVTHDDGHLVTSFGIGICKPLFSTMNRINEAGIKTKGKFTVDPRPYDYKNVKCSLLEKLVFSKILYSQQKRYEGQLTKAGLRDANAFTCTSYLPEVGNTPKKGDVLSWAESSAVVFVNSVLGARCNRNSGMLDLFGSILGYVPEFGFLTDKGRKATWKVIVKTSKLPEAQILGSAIGMKVMEDVPYVVGLDKFLGTELTETAIGYLKDFGAATASNGAVGLYHIENLTPEAKEFKEKLLAPNTKEYIVDDEEIERVYREYPIMWKDKDKKGNLIFIGCPHLSYQQLCDWTDKISSGLKETGRKRVAIRTILTSSPDVVEKFKKSEKYEDLMKTGAKLSSICALMYTNNPLTKKKRIITSSNKLRTYSLARYYKDEEVLNFVIGKEGK
ncbi:MAG TPA: aconitase X [Bacilli bacterium]|jgi:predicted aconitase|nr:aconitase X [Bacilli bacterium]HPY79647.1 aconitase X [Bacilli bacterium]HQA55713.1 aconitase X [Bacilli bacterium]